MEDQFENMSLEEERSVTSDNSMCTKHVVDSGSICNKSSSYPLTTSVKSDSSQPNSDVESDDNQMLETLPSCSTSTGNSATNSENFTLFRGYNQCLQEKFMANYSSGFPTPTLFDDLAAKAAYHSAITKKNYNWAVIGFGLSNFLSYASYFCKNEAKGGLTEVISIGSGDGSLDNAIIEAYKNHFGCKLDITSVDKNPQFKADYRTVNDLLDKCPNVVRNCVLLIMWPEPSGNNDGYDIEAICKLQPNAVFTVYEPTEISGSYVFVKLLSKKKDRLIKKTNFSLDNYAIEEVARQEVYLNAGNHVELWENCKRKIEPGMRAYSFKMVKLLRMD